ncbi:DUF3027 domain-containing protein [Natronoglycomyces albus]|uniref:DUF3027 domain-containing protein n=1 Tax=Natronoglycomyces albus TaxID=2811108 RepID=UPI0031B5E131
MDKICAEATDLAREAIADVAEGVGEYLCAEPEAERTVTHFFECTLPGYRGWRWAVVVTRVSRARTATVCESALLPGPDALRAPAWVPWSERVEAGDVGVGEILPTEEDDDRLMPAYQYSEDDAVEEVAYELGVGRKRVLNREGRQEAAQRWYEGPGGPKSDAAKSAPDAARCGTCGFYLPLAGSMRQVFGVCANSFASDDGRAVSADHGCGAHSEISDFIQIDESNIDRTGVVYDDESPDQL